ncbi:MAG: diguanylate cyclase [Candidatus Omnitrophota bacterium]
MEEQINILIVDDEEVMRSLMRDVLTDAGYKVDTVLCGEEAIDKIKQNEISILVTDLKMPGMDGTEVLRKVKAINSDICVIVVTAYPSLESAIEAMRHGAYDYIVKPFNIEEIKLVLGRAVERQQLLSEASEKEFYQQMAIRDGLTGLYNHRHLYDVLSYEIERALRYKHSVGFLMLDLDNFKIYNDTYGHLAGDKLLQDFARLFISVVRAADMVFRYGGEEFAIVCPETSKQKVIEIARRLLNLSAEKLPLTLSIGIASYPDDGQVRDELISNADLALYQAKHLGKNRFCLFGIEKEEQHG